MFFRLLPVPCHQGGSHGPHMRFGACFTPDAFPDTPFPFHPGFAQALRVRSLNGWVIYRPRGCEHRILPLDYQKGVKVQYIFLWIFEWYFSLILSFLSRLSVPTIQLPVFQATLVRCHENEDSRVNDFSVCQLTSFVQSFFSSSSFLLMPPHERRQQDVCHHFAAQCHWSYILFVQNNRVMLVPWLVNESPQENQCTSFNLFYSRVLRTLFYTFVHTASQKTTISFYFCVALCTRV